MKRKSFVVVSLLLMAVGISFFAYSRHHAVESRNPLAMANVEALTKFEFPNADTQDYLSGEYWCCGPGSGVCSAAVKCSYLHDE